MSAAPEISVLLPVRDAAGTLDLALRSVARQRETRFECLIVDDGSSDASREVATSWERRDPRFRSLALPARGLVSALNEGLAACRGRFVARMDADDWMHRDRLARQAKALGTTKGEGLAAVGSHVRITPRASLSDGMRAYESWLTSIRCAADVRRERFIECPIVHPTLFARREVLLDFGYRNKGWPEDYDLILRMLGKGCEIGMVPERLLGWQDHPERLSRSHASYSTQRFTECKAEHLARGCLAKREDYILWGHGPTARRLRKALARRGRHPSHIVEVHPRRIGQRIGGVRVISADELAELPRPRPPLLTAVSGATPRAEIRAELGKLGFREERDFVCAA